MSRSARSRRARPAGPPPPISRVPPPAPVMLRPSEQGALRRWVRGRLGDWTVPRALTMAVAVTVVCAATALGVSALLPPVYGAQADILYRSQQEQGAQAERELATQVVILRGRSVLQPVADDAGMSVEVLQENVDVQVVGESQVLRLVVGDTDAERALRLADAIAESYVRSLSEDSAGTVGEGTDFIENRMEALRLESQRIERELARLQAQRGPLSESTAEERRLHAEAGQLVERMGTLQDRLVLLELEEAPFARGRVLTPAYLLEDPIAPKPVQAAAGGALVGLLLGGGLLGLLAWSGRLR